MEYLIMCLISFIGSGLTLFSGFGLGTLLTPVFAIFFPIELAIGMTAIVHFLNNIFKFFLLGKYADKKIVLKFGVPSLIAAFIGAWVLTKISGLSSLYDYTISEKTFHATPVKLTISILLIFFSLFEVFPSVFFRRDAYGTKRGSRSGHTKEHLIAGGLLSGFFGGLSGNQGALRSAFLVKADLSKEQFIATGVIIACMVDATRIFVYNNLYSLKHSDINYNLLIAAVLSAFAGAYLGSRFLKKVTLVFLQKLVTAMLLVFAVLLSAGII